MCVSRINSEIFKENVNNVHKVNKFTMEFVIKFVNQELTEDVMEIVQTVVINKSSTEGNV